MKTQEILNTEITGKFEVVICLENHNAQPGIEFDNLKEAVQLANSLTWERCKNECNHTDGDVFGYHQYGIDVLLKTDMFGKDCIDENGCYPILWSCLVGD